MLEEFGEATGKDHRSALKRFWQTKGGLSASQSPHRPTGGKLFTARCFSKSIHKRDASDMNVYVGGATAKRFTK